MLTENDIRHATEELISHLGLEATVEVTQDGDVFLVNLLGQDIKLIERSRDNKAGALVTILKLIVKQKTGTEPRIILDLNGQRTSRLESLAQMARKKAEMVRITGMEEEMPPMTGAERRAVHMALKEMTGIKTESRGEEPHRRVIIQNDESADVM